MPLSLPCPKVHKLYLTLFSCLLCLYFLESGDEITNNGKFELSLLGDSVNEPKSDFIEMEIRYASSDVMFNELGDISWFESNAFINTESPNPM